MYGCQPATSCRVCLVIHKVEQPSPIQVLTTIYIAYLERVNHSTCIVIKACFHSKAVEVVYIPVSITIKKKAASQPT